MMETILMVIQNQVKKANHQKDHLAKILEIQEQMAVLVEYQKTIKWMWIATMIGAFLLGWLVCWMVL